MKTIAAFLLALAALFAGVSPSAVAVASTSDGGYTSFASGSNSCAQILREEREDKIFHDLNSFWVLGFMTAAGRFVDTEKVLLDVADHEGIWHLVREYCKENPLHKLTDAAENAAIKLLDRARLRTSESSSSDSSGGDCSLCFPSMMGDIAEVKRLIAAKVDVNTVDDNGYMALIFAAGEGNAEIVKMLLSAGANPNAITKIGNTALSLAQEKGHSEVVRLLEEAGAKE